MKAKYLSLLLLLLHLGAIESADIKLDPGVQKISDDYFNWRMIDMPQFATFVGIHTYDALLDDMSEEAYLDRLKKCQEFLQRATDLEPSLTTESDKVNIKVLKYELETYIDSYELKGIYLPVNFLEGPQIDMERTFGWMVLNNYNDYDVMIRRMERIPLQMDQIIDLMKAGVATNITYNGISVKDMDTKIGRFVVEDPTDSPLYIFFQTDFPASLTTDQISYLQTRAQNVIKDKVSPAYAKLRDYIVNEYVPREDIAVTTMFRGEEYYKTLILFHTSTNTSAEEIHAIGLSEVERIEHEIQKIISEMGYGEMSFLDFANMMRSDPTNYYNTSDEEMAAFEHIVYDLVPPSLPIDFKNIPEAELAVVEAPDPDGTGAFYLTGSYDGTRPGVFYVNDYDPANQAKFSMLSLSLHEGNPGHHLQGSHNIESPYFPFFRRVLEDRNYGISPSRFPLYTYYTEGWGLYAEGLGFDLNLYADPLDRYGYYSQEIFRACRLVVDTGMHALGWTRQQAIDFMVDHSSKTRDSVENEIDRYITWPGQALAYKMGQIRFSQLRSEAERKLGDLFDIKDFHDVVLNSYGSMDIVEEEVNLWINKTLTEGNKKRK